MHNTVSTTRSVAPFRTVLIGCITTCIAVASVYLTQPVLVEIGGAFGVTASDARLAFSTVSIAYAAAFFFMGPLTDRLDPRRMAFLGLSAAALSLAAASAVEGFQALLMLFAIQGVAAALVPAAMFALLPRIAPKERLGTYFGMVIAATVVGITLGRAGMSLVTAHWGLQGALRFWAMLLIVGAALNQALPSSTSPATSISMASAYVKAMRLLGTGMLLRLFGTGFLLFFGYLGVLTFLTLRLHQPPFLFDNQAIGSFSLLGLIAVFGAPLSGRLIASLGSLRVALGGLVLVLIGIACLACAIEETVLSIGFVLLFFGVFSCQPAVFVRIAERVDPDRRGAATSLYLLTCLGAGSVASVWLGTAWAAGGWPLVTAVSAASVIAAIVLLGIDAWLSGRGVPPKF